MAENTTSLNGHLIEQMSSLPSGSEVTGDVDFDPGHEDAARQAAERVGVETDALDRLEEGYIGRGMSPDGARVVVDEIVADMIGVVSDEEKPGALFTGVVGISRPGKQSKTAERVNDVCNDDPKLCETTLQEAELGGVDVEEVTEELDAAERSLDKRKFVNDILEREMLTDSMRPSYTINGKKVAFRSAGEAPDILGAKYIDKIYNSPQDGEDKAKIKSSFIEAAYDRDGDVLIATNSPEGILGLARKLAEPNSKSSENINEMINDIQKGGPYSEKVKELTDQIVACAMFDKNGTALDDKVDEDAYALVTVSLCGNENASRIVSNRLDIFRETLQKRQERIHDACAADRETISEYMEQHNIPEISPSDIALVHSTKHKVERDSKGNVILSPTSAHEQRSIRSSIHFTPNGQVTSHGYGAWSNKNRLIVANFQNMIDRNGNPAVMSGADTYFTRSPGETLVLEGALVVEPVDKLPNGQEAVVYESEDGYEYLSVENYDENQKLQIEEQAKKYGLEIVSDSLAGTLREVALRMAERRLGVSSFTTIGAHSVSDLTLEAQYRCLADRLGCQDVGHMDSAEFALESMQSGFLDESEWRDSFLAPSSGLYGGLNGWRPINGDKIPQLDALRTMAWAGGLPAIDIEAVEKERSLKYHSSGLEY